MKFRRWHVILTEIANMSPGQKNLESCQTNVLEQSLSSPLAFPILVNIKPYQKYTKITQNAVFNFFGAKFGVLPFLQECPRRFGPLLDLCRSQPVLLLEFIILNTFGSTQLDLLN